MRPTVLLFNISGKKLSTIRLCAVKMGIKPLLISRESFGNSLAELLSEDAAPVCADIGGEMLVMCAFLPGQLDAFLNEIRKKGAGVTMKAVLTETNSEWSADRLFHEISSEYEAFQRGKTAH